MLSLQSIDLDRVRGGGIGSSHDGTYDNRPRPKPPMGSGYCLDRYLLVVPCGR